MPNNKTILITGATSGIGEACATLFAEHGAILYLCARREDLLNTFANNLREKYKATVHTFILDVRDRTQVKQQLAQLPPIDIIINNAGLAAGLELLQEGNIDDWEAMIDTNIKGLLFVTRVLLPKMVERKSGHIVNIGSISSHQVYPKGAVYCATKFAVKALSQGLRMDVLGTNIRVTMISPGAVETNFSVVRFKGDQAKADAVYEGFTPLSAEDVADAVFYAVTRKPHINVAEILLTPTAQVSATLVSRT